MIFTFLLRIDLDLVHASSRSCGDGFHEDVFTDAQLDALVSRSQLVEAEINAADQIIRRQNHHGSQEVPERKTEIHMLITDHR